MTDYLLDTNLLIEKPDYSRLPKSDEDDDSFSTSSICYAELLEGEFSDNPTTAADSIIQYAGAIAELGDGIPFGPEK